MSSLSIFSFDSARFSCFSVNDQVWFRASDVCRFLGFANTFKAIELHASGRYKQFTMGKGRPANYLSEPGFYAMVFAAGSPDAIRFQDFVFDEILPSIRKAGVYIAPNVSETQAVAAIDRLKAILDKPNPWDRLTEKNTIDRIHEFYGQYCSETFWWKYIYHWMEEEDRDRLNKLNPIDRATRQRKTKIHQWVTTEEGLRDSLKGKLSAVVNILQASSSRTAFEDNMMRFEGFDQISLFG